MSILLKYNLATLGPLVRPPATVTLIAGLALALGASGELASLTISAGTGPLPTLPAPQPSPIPTANIAPAMGWPAGATLQAAPGTRVAAFASGLDHQQGRPVGLHRARRGREWHRRAVAMHGAQRRQGEVRSARRNARMHHPRFETPRVPGDQQCGHARTFRQAGDGHPRLVHRMQQADLVDRPHDQSGFAICHESA